MSDCEDLAGPAHIETALAKRPFTLRPVAGNAHELNVATFNRGVKGGSNGSLPSNSPVQRPATDASARGRAGLVRARRSSPAAKHFIHPGPLQRFVRRRLQLWLA